MPAPLVQIVPKTGEYSADAWEPWQNAEGMSAQALGLLALNKWLRESGYQHRHHGARPQFEPFTLDVYVVTSKDPRHPNGRPAACHKLTVCITPTNPTE
jgi:hypothetical protein